MKSYAEATHDPSEITFNKELSSARVAIECAFGRLKSPWRILQKRLDSRITFSVKIAVACAVLHNFCIKMTFLRRRWLPQKRTEQWLHAGRGSYKRVAKRQSLTFFKLILIISYLDLRTFAVSDFSKRKWKKMNNQIQWYCIVICAWHSCWIIRNDFHHSNEVPVVQISREKCIKDNLS